MAATRRPDAAVDPRLPFLIGLKLFFLLVCLFVLLRPELPQFAGKAMLPRALGYPVAVVVLPAVWALRNRGSAERAPYPYAADALITLPFVLDLLGNVFDLFDTVAPFDDALHFVNWGLLSAGVGMLLLRTALPPGAIAALVVGFGATAAILWEGLEFLVFIRASPEVATAYVDTLGDQHLGLLGSALAAAVVWRIARSRPASLADPSARPLAPPASGA